MEHKHTVIERAERKWNAEADEHDQWSELGIGEKTSLCNKEALQLGDVVFFLKSGDRVKLIEELGIVDGAREWRVERIDGESAGKQMISRSPSLKWCLSGQEEEILVD